MAEVNGAPERFAADIVVVSCGAANSAALLLRSANDKHPAGLANGSGQVGRNYMFHNSQAVLALSLTPNDTMFQKTLALNDFYFGMEGFPYPMGNIQMIGKTLGGMYRAEKPLLTALMPDRALDEIARHAVDFWLTTEDLPDPDNRVTVDRDGRITLAYKPNNQVPMRKLYDKLRAMLGEIGLQPQHLVARDLYMQQRYSVGRLRASGGHLPVRRRSRPSPCSTATARRTNSTISMSSTPVSSSASAR